MELAREKVENNDFVFVGFFKTPDEKIGKLELFHSFSSNFVNMNNFEVKVVDIDSLYPAPAETKLTDCIRTGKHRFRL